MSAFCAKGLGFDPLPSLPFLYELLSTASAASISAAFAALIIHCKCRDDYDFFPYGQSTSMQFYSVVLVKRLFSTPVHAGKYKNIICFYIYILQV